MPTSNAISRERIRRTSHQQMAHDVIPSATPQRRKRILLRARAYIMKQVGPHCAHPNAPHRPTSRRSRSQNKAQKPTRIPLSFDPPSGSLPPSALVRHSCRHNFCHADHTSTAVPALLRRTHTHTQTSREACARVGRNNADYGSGNFTYALSRSVGVPRRAHPPPRLVNAATSTMPSFRLASPHPVRKWRTCPSDTALVSALHTPLLGLDRTHNRSCLFLFFSLGLHTVPAIFCLYPLASHSLECRGYTTIITMPPPKHTLL